MKQSWYRERDYTFGQLIQKLRSDIGLTQTQLAEYLGVSRRAIGDWEGGSSYPKPQHLKQFIELSVEHQVFEVGREAEEIRELWRAAHQKLLIDEIWLATLLQQSPPKTLNRENSRVEEIDILTLSELNQKKPQVDWDEAPSSSSFYGRKEELTQLQNWVVGENCRVVGLVGMSGIGKSALVVNFMHSVAPHFEAVIWRSARNTPDCQALLDDYLQFLSPQAVNNGSFNLERRLALLLEQLQNRRILLILDNLETVLKKELESGWSGANYKDYWQLVQRLAETTHQSCFLFTSRRKPNEIVALEGTRSTVRVMRLTSLESKACEQLLAEKSVTGESWEVSSLIQAYTGNPLALKITAQTIHDLFDGHLAPFLAQNQLIFGGVQALLSEQFSQLPSVEQSVLVWLAILREPATLADLLKALFIPLPRIRLLEAIEALHYNSLIEQGSKRGSFTLQPVILEFVTAWFVTEACLEIESGNFKRLNEFSLALAQVTDYSRQAQLQFLAIPVLNYLSNVYHNQSLLEVHLLTLLEPLRSQSQNSQGYGPANLVTLLQILRGDLRGLDLSQLWLRGVSLQGVEMQDASLVETTIQASIFTQPFDSISNVAISSNGEYWAASTTCGEVLVWEAGGENLVRVWQAHTEGIWSLCFSPDGELLASGSWDGKVKLWEVRSGALIWSRYHRSNINSIAFAPDGNILASAGSYEIILWEVKSGIQLQTLSHSNLIISIKWSPKGGIIATGDAVGQIQLWTVNLAEGTRNMLTIEAHSATVSEIAFNPDGGTLASASYDGTVRLWNTANGQLYQTLTGHSERVNCVCWSPDGRLLASGGYDKIICLWDVEQNSYQGRLQGHTDLVRGLAFTPDNAYLVSGGDSSLRVWDSGNGRSVHFLQANNEALFDIDWCPDNVHLVSGGSNKLVTTYNAMNGLLLRELQGHNGQVLGVAWSPNGKRVASSSWDATVRIWNVTTGENLHVLKAPSNRLNFFYGLSWSTDGQQLAGATYYNSVDVLVWNANDGLLVWQSFEHSTPIRRIVWSSDNRWLAGGGDDGKLYLWDASDGKLLKHLIGHQGPVKSVAWNSDNSLLVSAGGDGSGSEVLVWDVSRGERIDTLKNHLGIVYAAIWDRQNDQIITGGSDGRLRWWEVARREYVAVQEAHRGIIQSLKLSPDGTKLASCGDDGLIMLWDLATGKHLKTIRRDRPYERLNIIGIKGLTEIQKFTLHNLGAFEE